MGKHTQMRNIQRIPKHHRPSILKRLAAAALLGFILLAGGAIDAVADVQVSFLYKLSSFEGAIPYTWPNLFVDEERNEIYAVDTMERDIRIFNDKGMEVYRLGDDGTFGSIVDVAVKTDGSILVLKRNNASYSILVCNYRGEPESELALKEFPPDFGDFKTNRMVYRQQRLYLLDNISLKLAVTDTNGFFQTGYDLAALVGVEEKKRHQTDVGGFSVDRRGNILFTIPVLFAAYKLSPDGKITGFGRPGSAPGAFNNIGGIVADERGYYYVADRLKSVVLIFDENFRFLKQFGYRGYRPKNLIGPKDLVLDSHGRLYVSQLQSRGVSVFQLKYDNIQNN
jgi:hypothetical protein